MPENSPRRNKDALDKAREASRAQNYSEALEQYEYFFEHALDNDRASYGVRLSYCLSEWADLGLKYPAAMERLVQKKTEALTLLEQTRNPERFHDYMAICEYLKCSDQTISQFLAYHSTDPSLAESIVRFIWNDLVIAQQWNVCAAYLTDSMDAYQTTLIAFDQIMDGRKDYPDLVDDDLENQIKGRYVRNVSNILLVLKNNGRTDEVLQLQQALVSDLQTRGYTELIPEILTRASIMEE